MFKRFQLSENHFNLSLIPSYGKAAAEAVINQLNTETTTASLYNDRFAIYAGIFDGLVNNITLLSTNVVTKKFQNHVEYNT